MINSIVDMYERGAITADHLAAQCLHLVDPADPASVLDFLPREALDRMIAYVEKYRSDRMISSYGLPPTIDQVEAANRWFSALSNPPAER